MSAHGLPVDRLPDETLLLGLGGDSAEVELAFIRRFQRAVFGVALAVLGDSALAEDVAQQTFERAWRHARAYDSRRGSVRAWLISIALNLAIEMSRVRRPVRLEPERLLHLAAANRDTPERQTVATETIAELTSALAALPAEQARAVVYAAIHRMTAEHIAECEGIPVGTAKTRIRSGMGKLHAALAASEPIMTDQLCTRIRELVPELALGLLDGGERAQAVAHLECCPACRAVVREHTEVVSALITLIPDVEPPAGFENRVLASTSGEQPTDADGDPWYRRRWTPAMVVFNTVLIAAALVAVIVLKQPAQQPPPAAGTPASAPLLQDGRKVGEVYLNRRGDPWILSMSVQLQGESGQVSCWLVTRTGRQRDLGSVTLTSGVGDWWANLPPDIGTPESVSVVDATGQVLATARFGR